MKEFIAGKTYIPASYPSIDEEEYEQIRKL